MDEDYNPNKPENMDKEIDMIVNEEDDHDAFDNLSVDSDDEDEHKLVERKFNFLAEISSLIDYDIISKYLLVIRDKDYKKNPQLLPAIT